MTTRHHLEFQSTDNRYSEPTRTADYEEFITRYDEGENQPTLEQWVKEMIKLYTVPGRVRVWFVTRDELDPNSVDGWFSGLAQGSMEGEGRSE